MGPVDFIIIGIVVLIVALAACYVIRAKKNGAKCIGCPSNCGCSKSEKGKSETENACSSCGSCTSCGACGGDEEADSKK